MSKRGGGVCPCVCVCVTTSNVFGVKAQLWWGLVAPSHSHDEELCLPPPPPPLSGRLSGEGRRRTHRQSSTIGWLEKPTLSVRHVQPGVGSLTESLQLKTLIKVQDVADVLRLTTRAVYGDAFQGQEGVGVVLREADRAPPRFKRVFIGRFTPTSASPSALRRDPTQKDRSVPAALRHLQHRGQFPSAARRRRSHPPTPPPPPQPRPPRFGFIRNAGFPWTCTQTRGSGPKWEYAADSAMTAALIYLHCSAPPPPFPFAFPCLTLSPSLPPNPLHSRSAILEHRGGESRYAAKSSVLPPSVDGGGPVLTTCRCRECRPPVY